MQWGGDLGGTRVILDREVEKNLLLPSLHQLYPQVTTESPFIVRMIALKVISNTGLEKGMEKRKAVTSFLFANTIKEMYRKHKPCKQATALQCIKV